MAKCLRFGRFEVVPDERQLLDGGRPVALGSRAFDLLLALVERRNRLVSKAELLDLIWPGLVVEEANLPVQISTLRKFIGAQSVATVPGRGYRFSMTVIEDEAVTSVDTESGNVRELGTNVPAAMDILFGREPDVDTLGRWLTEFRLVTVLGAGGIGKTRVAQAVARAAVGSFRDGVWWVDLSALSDPEDLARTIASSAQLRLGEGDAATLLGRALLRQEVLLVLDNCEHLAAAIARIVSALLKGATGVRVLTTSQEALKVDGEHLYLLSSLAAPPLGVSLATARGFPAVMLLEHRARALDPRFALTATTVQRAIEICRQLDGLALAIEMAAARLPLLGMEGLHSRLGERMRLLRTACREAPSRQRTLRATLAWSHELLDATERAVLRRLSVFAGGFRLDAALQTASFAGLDADAVLEALAGLVDKSLVAVEGAADPPRYRMLETMRMFASEQLMAACEESQAQTRHAAATLAVLVHIDQRAWTMTGDMLNAQLSPELENVRAALGWAHGDEGDPITAVALATRSTWLWDSLNLAREGVAHLASVSKWVNDSIPLPLQAAYYRARTFFYFIGDNEPPLASVAARSIELARRQNDAPSLYDALVRSAILGARSGQVEQSQRSLAEAAEIEDPSWPPRQRATRFFAQAECFEASSRLDLARAAQEMRIDLLRQAGELAVSVHAHSQLLLLELACGEVDKAIARGQRVQADLAPRCLPFRSRLLQIALAQALVAGDRLDEAILLAKMAVPMLAGSAAQWLALDLLAQIWAKRNDLSRAARLLACADRMCSLHGVTRKPHAESARAALLSRFSEVFTAAELSGLQAQGSALPEDGAIALAMDF